MNGNWPPNREARRGNLSPDEVARTDRQRRGGDGTLQGDSFERIVVLVRMLDLAQDWIVNGQTGDGGRIARQLWGPVDDIAVLKPSGFQTFVQARSGLDVHWASGRKRLSAVYGRFLVHFAKELDASRMQIAVSHRCGTLLELEDAVAALASCEVEVYELADLPGGFRSNAELRGGLAAICVDRKIPTLLNACVVLESSVSSLTGGQGRRVATVRSLLMQAKSVAPSLFSFGLVDDPTIAEAVNELAALMPLDFEVSGSTVAVRDLVEGEYVLDLASPAIMRAFVDLLTEALPETVMEVLELWEGTGG